MNVFLLSVLLVQLVLADLVPADPRQARSAEVVGSACDLLGRYSQSLDRISAELGFVAIPEFDQTLLAYCANLEVGLAHLSLRVDKATLIAVSMQQVSRVLETVSRGLSAVIPQIADWMTSEILYEEDPLLDELFALDEEADFLRSEVSRMSPTIFVMRG